MKVFFRVDSSNEVGTGHVRRCLTIAKGLKAIGVKDVVFICSRLDGNIIDDISNHSFEVRIIARSSEFNLKDVQQYRVPEINRLYQVQVEDAEQTVAVLKNEQPNILLIDSYLIAETWENIVRPYVKSLVVIDDLANRFHNCDIIIDNNFSDILDRYDLLVPSQCRKLCGTKYVLLNQDFLSVSNTRESIVNITKILIFFSGSVELNPFAVSVVNKLTSVNPDSIHIDVVVGGDNEDVIEVTNSITRPNTTAFGSVPNFVQLMKNANLAIGAGGITNWERCYLGLPAIVVAIAKNQVPSSSSLSKGDYINYVGELSDESPAKIEEIVHHFINNTVLLNRQSKLCQKLVDGKGLNRVLISLLPKSYFSFSLREATSDDVDLYFDWVNDPEVRRSALNTSLITFVNHVQWFNKQIISNDAFMFVYECDGVAIGQTRFNIIDGIAYIDYSIDALARGKGIGYCMLKDAIKRFSDFNNILIVAEVKKENPASISIFEKLHFEKFLETDTTFSFQKK
jgi:UDP-2,4-diacetamido-2,4,6-trideoxy-beta-L-altropyranose hydrolase